MKKTCHFGYLPMGVPSSVIPLFGLRNRSGGFGRAGKNEIQVFHTGSFYRMSRYGTGARDTQVSMARGKKQSIMV